MSRERQRGIRKWQVMSAYAIEIEERGKGGKRGRGCMYTGLKDRGLCVARVRHLCTHPWLFWGRVNRKLSVDLLRRRRDGSRLGHLVLGITTLRLHVFG